MPAGPPGLLPRDAVVVAAVVVDGGWREGDIKKLIKKPFIPPSRIQFEFSNRISLYVMLWTL